jgi:hypothetical protein
LILVPASPFSVFELEIHSFHLSLMVMTLLEGLWAMTFLQECFVIGLEPLPNFDPFSYQVVS